MADILYVPGREQLVATNARAFLHWLRTVRGITATDWAALQRLSADRPVDFGAAVSAFARLPDRPLRLAEHAGAQEGLVIRSSDGLRTALARDQLRHSPPSPLLHSGDGIRGNSLDAVLRRLWPPALLIRPLAELLLHADLRPDDRVLVVGPSWPWVTALVEGIVIILAAATPATLLGVAGEERANVLVAPAQDLAEAAFQRTHARPDLGRLRSIIATGGPLSPEGRRRVYTWVKSDLMLLARNGDAFWGNPLEPVLVRPPATPAFFVPRASDPARV